ncbi:MAG: glutamate-1-semialdehyde 2,1-aminomutase [Psittacicella sp.]
MHNSKQLFEKSLEAIPGGVNSPVRAFSGLDISPVFIKKANGAYIYSVENKKYIDYVGSWGPMILGHNNLKIKNALQKQSKKGVSFGAPTEIELRLAQKIKSLIPSIEKIRMVNSGTEATMSAIRLARGYTGLSKIIKFAGCYHGHVDALLVAAGSGALTNNKPTSKGIPTGVINETIVCEYNNLDSVREAFNTYNDIAAIIVEPIAGNMNCIPPVPGFLEGLRKITKEHNSILIFDEVMTGFRVSLGGAQELYNITPDLTCFGKIIGGGLPVGAYGGKAEIMDHISPIGDVYQAGTLSGNPLAMAAGLSCISQISKKGIFEELTKKTLQLTNGILELGKKYNINVITNAVGAMFGIIFSDHPVYNLNDMNSINSQTFKIFFKSMLNSGIYLAPSAYEAGFMSLAHSDEDIKKTLKAIEKSFIKINEELQKIK